MPVLALIQTQQFTLLEQDVIMDDCSHVVTGGYTVWHHEHVAQYPLVCSLAKLRVMTREQYGAPIQCGMVVTPEHPPRDCQSSSQVSQLICQIVKVPTIAGHWHIFLEIF